jgi:hypothetical protein
MFLLEHRRDVLLPVQHLGWLQPLHRELGHHPRLDDRGRHRDHLAEGEGEVPQARPRAISDNGPQFITKDFKEFIRISGMTHVRTSPFYRNRNGKIERWHKSLKGECIRPGTPLSLDDVATSLRRTCWLGGSRRSTRSATGGWRRRGSNGRFVASKPFDVQLTPVGRGSAGDGLSIGCGVSTSGSPTILELTGSQRKWRLVKPNS